MGWLSRIFGGKTEAPARTQKITPTQRSWFPNEKGFPTYEDGPWRIVVAPKSCNGRTFWQYVASQNGNYLHFSHLIPTEDTAKRIGALHRMAMENSGAPPVIGIVELYPSEDDLFDIVGESHYQEALETIAGPKTKDGADREVVAFLIPDPENRYDKKSVEVIINDQRVGHLSRDDNEEFLEFLQDVGASQAICRARVRAGWKNAKSEGSFCVQLDIDWPPSAAE